MYFMIHLPKLHKYFEKKIANYRTGNPTINYFNRNYSVFVIFEWSGILENRKHDVLEAGPVSVLR
jgi:hypothetical protein